MRIPMCEVCQDSRKTNMAIERVAVRSNDRVCEGVGLMVLEAPVTASKVWPGQFVHIRIATDREFMLRRPFSVHRAHGGNLEILYQVLGRGTRTMSLAQRDDRMDLIGPLGHGWDIPDGLTHALLVAGGLGAAPLGMLAEELARRGVAATVVMGAPTGERLVARDLFERVARRVESCTDDGSAGEKGFVTVATRRLLDEGGFDMVYACGPEVMARAVADQAFEADVACQVSLERLMACGIGACLSCVVATAHGQKRACVDGPVFDAREVSWDVSEIPPRH